MSSHVGEATASPSPPEGLDARQERYWLIERRCKDLCLYLDVLTRNMPRYEKYVLSAKMREIGIQPDFVVCRTEYPLGQELRDRISLFCNG